MKLKILFLLVILAVAIIVAPKAQAACQADVSLVIKDYNGQIIKGARFAIFEQLVDAAGQPAPGQLLASDFTDKFTGTGKVTVTLTDGLSKYAVKIVNPSFDGFDFWYFNQLTLTCGQTASFTASLSAIQLKVSDYLGLLQKNTKYIIYAQKQDFNGDPVLDKQVGAGDTGVLGDQTVYLPAISRTYGLTGVTAYLLEIKNSKGIKFYKYNLNPAEGQLQAINYRFSDLVVTIKDAQTAALLPNIRINVFQRLPGQTGGYITGQSISGMESDDKGIAYLQYPTGAYLLQYTQTNGEKINLPIDIKTEDRTPITWAITDYAQSRCDIKSSLALSFRDFDTKIIGSLSYNIYEQNLDNNGTPVMGAKVLSGQVDKNGLAKTDFAPQPAKRYMLQVCDKSQTFGCFWFTGITFQCQQDIFFGRDLKSVDVIFRNSKLQLQPGQRFKIYVKQTDVDGKIVVDKTKLVGIFTEPTNGDFRIYLDNRQLNGDPIDYLLALDIGQKEVYVPFAMNDDAPTILEYIIGDPLRQYIRPADVQLATRLAGRIVLKAQGDNSAWYISPLNRKRYRLTTTTDVMWVMRNLSTSATNANLSKIRPNLDYISPTDTDSDYDGLPDNLEVALGTDPNKADTDGDGYNDYIEVKTGYNPLGAGKMILDAKVAAKYAGRIVLQTQKHGEAWFINSVNKQRYYLSNSTTAQTVLRALGLSISNADLYKIPVGR